MHEKTPSSKQLVITMEELEDNPIPSFEKALENGTVKTKTSPHQYTKDNNNRYKNRAMRCECEIPVNSETKSYVKILIETREGHEILYYHQIPVYMKKNNEDFIAAPPHYKKKPVEKLLRNNLPKNYELKVRYATSNQPPKRNTWYIKPPSVEDKSVYKKEVRKRSAKLTTNPVQITKEHQVKENL